MRLHPIKAFSDNYIWCLENGEHALVVDPGDDNAVASWLEQRKLKLASILITHHHYDHCDGLDALQQNYNCQVYAPADKRIPGQWQAVSDSSKVSCPATGARFSILETPGHTSSHICYFGEGILFCGDTLFSMGCGRLFEGSPEQMHASLQKIAKLPGDTLVCPAHEYTESNIRFALQVEPDSDELQSLAMATRELRRESNPSLPVSLARELQLNPFLRCHEQVICDAVKKQEPDTSCEPVTVFAALRRWKDRS